MFWPQLPWRAGASLPLVFLPYRAPDERPAPPAVRSRLGWAGAGQSAARPYFHPVFASFQPALQGLWDPRLRPRRALRGAGPLSSPLRHFVGGVVGGGATASLSSSPCWACRLPPRPPGSAFSLSAALIPGRPTGGVGLCFGPALPQWRARCDRPRPFPFFSLLVVRLGSLASFQFPWDALSASQPLRPSLFRSVPYRTWRWSLLLLHPVVEGRPLRGGKGYLPLCKQGRSY